MQKAEIRLKHVARGITNDTHLLCRSRSDAKSQLRTSGGGGSFAGTGPAAKDPGLLPTRITKSPVNRSIRYLHGTWCVNRTKRGHSAASICIVCGESPAAEWIYNLAKPFGPALLCYAYLAPRICPTRRKYSFGVGQIPSIQIRSKDLLKISFPRNPQIAAT